TIWGRCRPRSATATCRRNRRRGGGSSSLHAREDEHLGARGDRAEPVVAIDLAVDRDGHPALQHRLQAGMLLAQPGQELLDVLRLDLELGAAAGRGPERAGERHLYHQWATISFGRPRPRWP